MDSLRNFIAEYGWRAYAIPVLSIITVWVVVDMIVNPAGNELTTTAGSTSATASAGSAPSRGTGPNPSQGGSSPLSITDLPAGGPYAESGAGTFRVVGVPGAGAGVGTEMAVRYIVEVEDGVDTASSGGDEAFARMVDSTLTDPRSWTHDEAFSFAHVSEDQEPNLRVILASVASTHRMCGAEDLEMETSCRTWLGDQSVVVINHARWVRGAVPFAGDIGSYRNYLINHEVGHAIGYAQHAPCGGTGQMAPVMMQQTLSLNNSELHRVAPEEVYEDDGATCVYNGWPYPQP